MLVEKKLLGRHRAVENLISLKAANARNEDFWSDVSDSETGWETSSDASFYSDSEMFKAQIAGEAVGSTSLPDKQMEKLQKLKKKQTYRKSIRHLRLTDSVEHVVRQMSSDGLWPAKIHFRKGDYAVGPSRVELREFQRKQSLFFEIKALLEHANFLAYWYPLNGILCELKSYVFKYLNTGLKGRFSLEQRYLLGEINFLLRSHKSPSVNWRSSNRATPSVDTFGYTMWTNSPKAVLTRF